jgi:tyrosyl-tRNA synthetase
MMDPRGEADSTAEAARLAAGAVDVLPEGRLAEQVAEGRPLRVKLGIDPTAPDIHLGHVVVLDKLRGFQDAGHVVVLIIGDFTGRVGDPSGQSAERPVLSPEQLDANAATFQEQAFKVLDEGRTEVRRNSEWLDMGTQRLFEMLRRFTVARLLERDDFAKRMEAGRPISVLEIIYPVLQGYDSVAVEADVELGGTEQKFNLLFARDVQQAFGQPGQSVMTMPILPGTDGKQRMSKSLGNYIGVTDPPEEMFGKLMSVPDETMGEYWRLVLGEDQPGGHPGAAKRQLARRVVERFWDRAAAEAAEERFDQVHVRREVPDDVEVAEIRSDWVGDGGEVHLPLLMEAEFGLSRSEARRLIAQGGVRIDGEVLGSDRLNVPVGELSGKVVQIGKRRFKRVVGSAEG